MESQTAAGPAESDAPPPPAAPIDPAVLEQAKEILVLLAHTFSAMKLFPDHHSTVLNFQNDLFHKLERYINDQGGLELGIRENAFEVGGARAFYDENVLRSLPYIFFKDGMRTLSFLPDLTREELVAFLNTVKEISNLPADVGDIVDALWEKELAHIQYFAPDDYLINKMATHKEHEIRVDRGRFGSGRLDLDSEDTAGVYKSLQALRYKEPKEDLEFQTVTSPMSELEVGHVQSLMSSQRGGAGQVDFLDMVYELLQLEDRTEHFDGVLGYLERLHGDWFKSANIGQISGLVRRLTELAGYLKAVSDERSAKVDALLERLRDQTPLDALQDMARQGKVRDHAVFFEYLAWIGPKTLLIGSDILENEKSGPIKDLAFRFLESLGRTDPMLLANLAQDRRPLTTRAAISVLGQANDRRFIPFLATFFAYKNKDIKLDAVRALGRITDPLAHKTLLGFLRSDPEPEIRIEAARTIHLDLDPNLLQAVVGIASGKSFFKREPEERTAILAGIGRGGREAGYALIRRAIERTTFFERKKTEAVALSAVEALVALGTPAAGEILRTASQKGRKRLRAAATEALGRLDKAAEGPESAPERTPA
jgi:HEAT repeat protein